MLKLDNDAQNSHHKSYLNILSVSNNDLDLPT